VRNDAVGFFWDDTPPPKPPKAEKEKRTPPAPTWLAQDYLPGLEESLRFPVHIMTDAEVVAAAQRGDEFVNDVEVYGNYFLSMFMHMPTGAVTFVERYDGHPLDIPKLRWLLDNLLTLGFNSLNYDLTMNAMAMAGFTCAQLKICSDKMIVEKLRPHEVLRAGGVKKLEVNHIDLIEIAPLDASLKTYGGRLHARKLQDLPFHPSTMLSPEQRAIVRWYCVNDCELTAHLRTHINEHIELRKQLGAQYNIDLRSHSDAQLAQEIINAEIKKVTGKWPKRPKKGEAVGTVFRYQPPSYIQFQTDELKSALADMTGSDIEVGPTGHAMCPKVIRKRTVVIAGKKYKIGMGGLHSTEKSQAIVGGPNVRIIDRDVTGYYPNLILKNGFAPARLGRTFLIALQAMVTRRTFAKKQMQAIEEAGGPFDQYYHDVKAEADGLKIANNGVFGKLSDPFSTVYDVPNMVQVTLTGQLSLLMIIEALEIAGIPVVSANTDGIVMACPADRYNDMVRLFAAWERHTGLETEETEYRALYSANVNNYIAVKMDDKTKTKGWYCERGSAHNSVLSKNPEALICSEAAQAYLSKGIPVEQTIRNCNDIRKFVSLRVVDGGGVKIWADHNEFIGKTVRWYYSNDVTGEFVYARSGNVVPKTEGARPLMRLPANDNIPADLNFNWYIEKAESILREVGAWEQLDVAS
jgi:hypothetical protein